MTIQLTETVSQASLLLPLEQSSGQEKITPEFMSDHVLMCDLLSKENTQVVTLSGLRGHLSRFAFSMLFVT
jgi:hypothetical protein